MPVIRVPVRHLLPPIFNGMHDLFFRLTIARAEAVIKNFSLFRTNTLSFLYGNIALNTHINKLIQ